jgi:hypothetical protein
MNIGYCKLDILICLDVTDGHNFLTTTAMTIRPT